MEAFELMMDDRHLDQRVTIERPIVIDESFQVAHQRHDLAVVLGRRVHMRPGPSMSVVSGILRNPALFSFNSA